MGESIYRAVDIYTKYAKNHPIPLNKRVPFWDRISKDWVICTQRKNKSMTLTKEQLIEMLQIQIPEDTIISVTKEVKRPQENNFLIGTTFGSVQHMILSDEKYTSNYSVNIQYKA